MSTQTLLWIPLALYCSAGLFCNLLTMDRPFSVSQRLWLIVEWPKYLRSRQSDEEKRKAREIEAARQADMRATREKKRER